ncbi:unnamed protein product [Owenia fusiformis]|uniref:Uncharacterized protein n=1 Tax=Owenia fusiformis TaxID=6347 RepID=A0A8J1XMT3_OWEFU|nr:unnamed protein product [Owenia fusiformis]
MMFKPKRCFLIIGIIILSIVGLLIQSEYTGLTQTLESIKKSTHKDLSADTTRPQLTRYTKQDENQTFAIQAKLGKLDQPISKNKSIDAIEVPTNTTQNNTKLTSVKLATTIPKTIPATKSVTTIPGKTIRSSNEISQARKVDSDKYIVFLCTGDYLCGGLGDRLKGIQSTFLLALALKRKYRIISTVPCDLYNQLEENQEPWHGPITPGLKNKTISMIDGYASCGNAIFGKTNTTKVDFDEKFPEPVLLIRTNQGWTHRFHEEPYKTMLTSIGLDITHFTAKKIISKVYNHLFKLKPNLLSRLHEFLSRIRSKPGMKLVCAQIRIGYNPSIPHETTKKKRNKEEWLPVLWDFLSLYNISSKYNLFITTDSQEIRDNSKKLFPEIIMDTEGEITHVDRFENKSKACEGMAKTILDFTILANCDITVVSRSNFGKLSSELQSPASKLYIPRGDNTRGARRKPGRKGV